MTTKGLLLICMLPFLQKFPLPPSPNTNLIQNSPNSRFQSISAKITVFWQAVRRIGGEITKRAKYINLVIDLSQISASKIGIFCPTKRVNPILDSGPPQHVRPGSARRAPGIEPAAPGDGIRSYSMLYVAGTR